MPERAFVTKTEPELLKILDAIDKAKTSGSLQELEIAGVKTKTSEVKQVFLDRSYNQARYELYLRAKASGDAAKIALYTNPYSERVMRVHTVYGVR